MLPAASARLLSQTFAQMTALSVVIGVVSVAGGMLLSYALDLPPGPVTVIWLFVPV